MKSRTRTTRPRCEPSKQGSFAFTAIVIGGAIVLGILGAFLLYPQKAVNDRKVSSEGQDLTIYENGKSQGSGASATKNPFAGMTATERSKQLGISLDDFREHSSLLLLVNKSHAIDEAYVPEDLQTVEVNVKGSHNQLRKPAAQAYERMVRAAAKDGVQLELGSGFRSGEVQKGIWQDYASRNGKDQADRFSARGGYSEHQTGLAIDFVTGYGESDGINYADDFEKTDEGKWLYNNAWKYGFILRYPKGKEAITGYMYEPWHYRYVGKKWAQSIHEVSPDFSFEEFFCVQGGTEYK